MTNQIALSFIAARESLRLRAYPDAGGRWTVGYGATGPNIGADTVWTRRQADSDLAARIDAEDRAVRALTSPAALSERGQAALISFAYNVGTGALIRSPVLAYVRAKNWMAAAKSMLLYDHVNGVEVRGLLKRRMEEAAMFLDGVQ